MQVNREAVGQETNKPAFFTVHSRHLGMMINQSYWKVNTLWEKHIKILSIVVIYMHYTLKINFDMKGDQSKRVWYLGTHRMASRRISRLYKFGKRTLRSQVGTWADKVREGALNINSAYLTVAGSNWPAIQTQQSLQEAGGNFRNTFCHSVLSGRLTRLALSLHLTQITEY